MTTANIPATPEPPVEQMSPEVSDLREQLSKSNDERDLLRAAIINHRLESIKKPSRVANIKLWDSLRKS